MDDDGRLAAYLNDHLAGSAAAIQLLQRLQGRDPESELGGYLATLLGEIEEDRGVLERVMSRVGAAPNPVKRATALGGELLTNLRNRLPVVGAGAEEVARLEEIELLSLGIEGKRLLWRALGSVAGSDPRLEEFDFVALESRAQVQRDGLERFRLETAREAFAAWREG